MKSMEIYYHGKRTIINHKPNTPLPIGKSGHQCCPRGFYERMQNHTWESLEWMSKKEILQEELDVNWESLPRHVRTTTIMWSIEFSEWMLCALFGAIMTAVFAVLLLDDVKYQCLFAIIMMFLAVTK